MEQLDRERAQRIWQRVQGTREKEDMPLAGWVYRSQQLRHGLTALQSQLGAQKMQNLLKRQKEHEHILRGLCLLHGENVPAVPDRGEGSLSEALLRRCIGLSLALAREYRRWEDDGEYGDVLACLRRLLQAQCAELIGLYGT